MSTKTKKTTKTEEARPVKAVALFDAGAIEFAVKSSILKNTLPEITDAWKNWLESYNATDLKTDEDFKSAAEFVSECKRTEEKLEEIREKALKGEVSKVIREIETMQETTRQKRLEFNKAVESRKNKIKTDAVTAALDKVSAALSNLDYRPEADRHEIEERLRTSIKGLSAILKMNEALVAESNKVIDEAKTYDANFRNYRFTVAGLYSDAGETATESELDMLVRTYQAGAVERAKFILDQKRVAREKAELERKRKEQEAREDQATQEAVPAPAPAAASAAQPSVLSTASVPGTTVRTLRFGATFDTTDPENTIRLINSIGGRDVRFVEMKK